jgi:hypothetical protein
MEGKRTYMLATSDQPDIEKMPYWLNVLIAIDQLGNAIAGGNPDNTISGRVGFFASDLHTSRIKGYWKALERTIDFTFEPLQGPKHCFGAWQGEQDETDTEVTYITRIILGIFVAVGCFFIGIALWLAILINPSWRYKAGESSYHSWRQARQSSADQHVPAAPVIPPVPSTL